MSRGRRSWSAFTVVGLSVMLIVNGSACGQRREGDEPTKYRSQAGLEHLTQQAAQKSKQASAQSGPINSRFSLSKNIIATTPTGKDIDSIIRPVLVKQFGDTRLLSATGPEKPQRDGEVVEDRMVYTVRTSLTEGAGDALHSAFRATGFATSPRLGSKPTHSRGNVYMSLMRTTSQRGYSFVITVDTGKQQIQVESYRLGSKYDRLM